MSIPSPAIPGQAPTPTTPSRRIPTTSRSIGFTPSSATNDNDWRQSPSTPAGGAKGDRNGNGGGNGGPGKTIGGFDKKENKDGKGDKDKEKEKASEKDKDKANLAHVPCRFFKQGACTAGANCPFSHSLPEAGKKEICSWFLKGNCKFGHKCALAHVRPGEPMSMDRKNKKEQQRETREKDGGAPEGKSRPTLPLGASPDTDTLASPVAIRSALSSSIQSPPTSAGPRHASSPMREPFGPPSAGGTAGFGRSPGQGVFASSPSRPSPLSASFSRPSGLVPGTPGSMALKSSATVAMHSPLRPPNSASAGMFSSSYSHVHLPPSERGTPAPLSASFADSSTHGALARNIWARADTPEEPLSPRRPILKHPRKSTEVFMDDGEEEEDHGEDFLPASLNDLLTPQERARRLSRRDSNDSYSFGASPARAGFLSAQWNNGGERLAQSAGANLGPANFLQSLWNNEGTDRRRVDDQHQPGAGASPAAHVGRQSLLTQTKSPISPQRYPLGLSPSIDSSLAYPLRPSPHPSSPSARAINEHAPGKSLPGGVATALSRLHLHNPEEQKVNGETKAETTITPEMGTVPLPSKREDHDDGLFAMDG